MTLVVVIKPFTSNVYLFRSIDDLGVHSSCDGLSCGNCKLHNCLLGFLGVRSSVGDWLCS